MDKSFTDLYDGVRKLNKTKKDNHHVLYIRNTWEQSV